MFVTEQVYELLTQLKMGPILGAEVQIKTVSEINYLSHFLVNTLYVIPALNSIIVIEDTF